MDRKNTDTVIHDENTEANNVCFRYKTNMIVIVVLIYTPTQKMNASENRWLCSTSATYDIYFTDSLLLCTQLGVDNVQTKLQSKLHSIAIYKEFLRYKNYSPKSYLRDYGSPQAKYRGNWA